MCPLTKAAQVALMSDLLGLVLTAALEQVVSGQLAPCALTDLVARASLRAVPTLLACFFGVAHHVEPLSGYLIRCNFDHGTSELRRLLPVCHQVDSN